MEELVVALIGIVVVLTTVVTTVWFILEAIEQGK
jgi:hypothetical protein